MSDAEIKTSLVVFYKCRWCLKVFDKKLDLDYTITPENFAEDVLGDERICKITKNGVKVPWTVCVHECNDDGKYGAADFIGVRPLKDYERKSRK